MIWLQLCCNWFAWGFASSLFNCGFSFDCVWCLVGLVVAGWLGVGWGLLVLGLKCGGFCVLFWCLVLCGWFRFLVVVVLLLWVGCLRFRLVALAGFVVGRFSACYRWFGWCMSLLFVVLGIAALLWCFSFWLVVSSLSVD